VAGGFIWTKTADRPVNNPEEALGIHGKAGTIGHSSVHGHGGEDLWVLGTVGEKEVTE